MNSLNLCNSADLSPLRTANLQPISRFEKTAKNFGGMIKFLQYIENQEEHHRNKGFKEELLEFLEKYGVEYDERYLWD